VKEERTQSKRKTKGTRDQTGTRGTNRTYFSREMISRGMEDKGSSTFEVNVDFGKKHEWAAPLQRNYKHTP